MLINAQDNLPPFPEIFFVQILRIIVWIFRTAELDVPNTDRPIRNAVYWVRFSGLFAGLQAVFLSLALARLNLPTTK